MGVERPELHAAGEEPDSFRAFFRNYQTANRYWDAPDGRRYWRGRFEIDRGQPDDVGQRRVGEGGQAAKAWDGPQLAPDGIGLYEQGRKGRWWPTEAALASGFQPCAWCEQTNRKRGDRRDPQGSASRRRIHRGPPRRSGVVPSLATSWPRCCALPFDADAATFQDNEGLIELARSRVDSSVPGVAEEVGMASRNVPKAEVVRKLLELRAREAPLGFSGYRGR